MRHGSVYHNELGRFNNSKNGRDRQDSIGDIIVVKLS